jgi:hypothetical protein
MSISGNMGPVLRERETETRTLLPAITRTIHNPIDSLGRTAEHMRTRSEGAYRNPHQADFALRVAANIENLGLEANPLPRRFARLIESL